MGQRDDVAAVGTGTVWIGSMVLEDTGGLGLAGFEGVVDADVGGAGCWT